MSDDTFFGDESDRTVIKPMPGGRPQATPQPASKPVVPPSQSGGNFSPSRPPSAPPPAAQPAYSAPGVDVGSGMNPLCDAATGLFALVGEIRSSMSKPNVDSLRAHITQQINVIETRARSAGVSAESILTARYALCALLDEIILSTPWGAESDWATHSLLITFHNESWAGEKFFQILDRLMQEPSRNLMTLEFLYICLVLGFEGKYRISNNGRVALDQVKDNLYRSLSMLKGDFERELSPHWRSNETRRNNLTSYVPLWVVAALAGTLLLTLYSGFKLYLDSSSDDVYQQLQLLGQSTDTTE